MYAYYTFKIKWQPRTGNLKVFKNYITRTGHNFSLKFVMLIVVWRINNVHIINLLQFQQTCIMVQWQDVLNINKDAKRHTSNILKLYFYENSRMTEEYSKQDDQQWSRSGDNRERFYLTVNCFNTLSSINNNKIFTVYIYHVLWLLWFFAL